MFRRVTVGLMVCVGLMAFGTAAFAHQSGGVEVGDLATGSVAGIGFKELDVDAELFALDLGGAAAKKVWYPPTTVVDFKVRPGRPLLIKVTNNSQAERGFFMSAAENQSAPTVLKAQVVLKPGESKYIGIPTSDLFYATSGNVLYYRDHLNKDVVGGRLLMIK